MEVGVTSIHWEETWDAVRHLTTSVQPHEKRITLSKKFTVPRLRNPGRGGKLYSRQPDRAPAPGHSPPWNCFTPSNTGSSRHSISTFLVFRISRHLPLPLKSVQPLEAGGPGHPISTLQMPFTWALTRAQGSFFRASSGKTGFIGKSDPHRRTNTRMLNIPIHILPT